jgi:hypothetical protein
MSNADFEGRLMAVADEDGRVSREQVEAVADELKAHCAAALARIEQDFADRPELQAWLRRRFDETLARLRGTLLGGRPH